MSDLIAGKLTQLADGVWRVLAPNPSVMTGPGTNSYLIGKTSLTLLDAGPASEQHITALKAAIKAIGLPLSHLICTHSHKDHSPAAAILADDFQVPCWGAPVVDDPHQDRRWQPDRSLDDNETVNLGGMRIKAIATPGHVANHLCYLLEDSHWLFSGDHLINGSTVVIIPPAGSMGDYIRSLKRLQQEQIEVMAPGHGDLICDPGTLITQTLSHRYAREAKVIDALNHAPASTAVELVPAVYQDVAKQLYPLAALSLKAHLIKLAEEGLAFTEGDKWFPPQSAQ